MFAVSGYAFISASEADCSVNRTDPCENHTCENNASCTRINNEHYECNCFAGFSGKNCSEKPCDRLGCWHGGTCTNFVKNSVVLRNCSCLEGYSGDYCQFKPCYIDPCLNDADCQDLTTGGYKCHCDPTKTGKNCGDSVCSTDPCENNGTCTEDIDAWAGYKCACSANYTGENCQIPV